MVISNNPGKISHVDASGRKAPGKPAISDSPGAFTRGPDRVHNFSRSTSSELKETAASIRNFVESKDRRIEFVFNGRPASAEPAFSGVNVDLPMNEHGREKQLFIHIGPYDNVSSNPKLTQGQLTASLILARSAMMEKDQLQVS
ncbi:MAG: hypothetical protein ACRYGA_12725 [Janthinobacterium lividum]